MHVLVGHVPVLGRSTARRDLVHGDVEAVAPHVIAFARSDCADVPVTRELVCAVVPADDLLAAVLILRPHDRPVLAGAVLLIWVRPGVDGALLQQTEGEVGRLRLHHERLGALVRVGVEVAVHRVGVHERPISLRPVVPLAVVDLVAAAFEDVEGGLVLVAVPRVRSSG